MTDEPEKPESESERLARRIAELELAHEAVTDQAREQAEALDDEFAARLEKLEAKAETAKVARQQVRAEERRRQASEGEAARGTGVGIQVAYMIMGTPLLLGGLGWLIDRAMKGGTLFSTIGVVGGATLGVTMAIVVLNRVENGPKT